MADKTFPDCVLSAPPCPDDDSAGVVGPLDMSLCVPVLMSSIVYTMAYTLQS